MKCPVCFQDAVKRDRELNFTCSNCDFLFRDIPDQIKLRENVRTISIFKDPIINAQCTTHKGVKKCQS